ncbi:hypothetical protein [Candidatus Nitrotoga sp. BS]|uniref:hypothetical protein n=1 Tax=Candidatus Nitrotoga sp. BS TaxID=2890408 RepID=UPI001EF366C2|nr:hypothetical protein [Candidatus Nitrotoga sp. BS]
MLQFGVGKMNHFSQVYEYTKACLAVKHGNNRSTNNCIPAQLTRKINGFAAFWRFRQKTLRGKGQPGDEEG